MVSTSLHDVDVRPSPIEGLGLFALRPFFSGQRIRQVNVVREVTPELPIQEERGERADHCDYPDGKVVLLGFPDRHINHSCDPNAYLAYEHACCYLVARRAIFAKDEISCDYDLNITDGTAWPCHCGAPRCRGQTVGDFFRLPVEVQREYRPLLADWFVKRYRNRLVAFDDEPCDAQSRPQPNQLPDPTSPSDTPPAGAGGAPSVAADH
jgi:hypothetical protein